MICCALSVFLLQGGVPQAKPVTAVRDPAYAADGRLAVSVRGDLWTVTRAGAWNRVTTGRDWDREPAWAADGRSIVYSSNHGGTFHIWRIPVGDSGAVGEAVRVTASGEMEREPSVAVDGRIAFARGKGSEARIWTRGLDGTEGRLTTGTTAERWPAFSPDGRRIAYVAVTESSRRLLVRMLDSAAGARSVDTVSSLAGIEHPSWSPDGRRLTFSVGGQRPAVFIAPVDGRYANVVALRHARSAW